MFTSMNQRDSASMELGDDIFNQKGRYTAIQGQ